MYKPGDRIYKYRLESKVGKGSFGEVWRATDTNLDQEIALKLLPVGEESVKTLLEGAVIGNKVSHTNLVPIYGADIVKANGVPVTVIAQQFMPSGCITTKATSGGYLILPDVLNILREILSGLDHLHHSGILHNDIKPTNILIGRNKQAVLSDYGIAGIFSNGGSAIAKDLYLAHCAPESASNRIISEYSDIYQVGVTAYRLLNGLSTVVSDLKTDNKSFQEKKALGKIPDPQGYRPWVPISLRRVINKSLNTVPVSRFSSALQMLRALERLNYAGYWTQDDHGYLGICKQHSFRVVETTKSSGVEVVALRKYESGKETKVKQFCKVGLSQKESAKVIHDFMIWVVEGAQYT